MKKIFIKKIEKIKNTTNSSTLENIYISHYHYSETRKYALLNINFPFHILKENKISYSDAIYIIQNINCPYSVLKIIYKERSSNKDNAFLLDKIKNHPNWRLSEFL